MKTAIILCVGTHESLQAARSMVLRRVGYSVETALGRSAAVVACGKHGFDVAIICDSLGSAAGERLAEELQVVSPRTKVIKLYRSACPPPEADSPELLLALIRAALKDGTATHTIEAHKQSVRKAG